MSTATLPETPDAHRAVIALTPAPQPLTERETRILAIAGTRFPNPGRREDYIRRHLDMDATRFYFLLGRIIDRPEAAEAYPVLVNRLRRQREQRRNPTGSQR